ncbi:hypothetical protein LCGC14_2359110 [marine sediment metagenome]|uniref:DUF1937 domain-containing protein n=1 Tax=marine sediment metagenome TaxID=412755 RepID=A0A0F9CUF1_9ZZZZ
MIYLASPYSNLHPEWRQALYERACEATIGLMKRKKVVFSPIVHCHPLAVLGGFGTDFKQWGKFCLRILKASDVMYILMLTDWEKSVGIAKEYLFCLEHSIPVKFLHPDSLRAVEFRTVYRWMQEEFLKNLEKHK